MFFLPKNIFNKNGMFDLLYINQSKTEIKLEEKE
jgi:hypothetical protein